MIPGDYLPEDVLLDIEKKLEPALSNVLQKYDIDYQIKASHEILKKEWDRISGKLFTSYCRVTLVLIVVVNERFTHENSYIHTDFVFMMLETNQTLDNNIMSMIKQMDSLRNSLYSGCVPEIRMLEELQIHDPPPAKSPSVVPTISPTKQTPSNFTDSEVTPLHAVNRSLGYDLPPQGPFSKQFPEVETKVFVMKHPLMPWVRGKVQQVITRSPIQCRVKLSGRRSNGAMRTLTGKHMANATPCSVIIPVATRVVAVFFDANSSDYYSGVIAEPPKSTNRYR